MTSPKKILVLHTAFLGDVILTLPLLQYLHDEFPDATITAVVTPACAPVLAHHPAVAEVMEYDKRGKARGPAGLLKIASDIRGRKFDVAIIPHRSLRSALVCRLANIPMRIGFDRSAARFLLTHIVKYNPADHEILRNLSLSTPLGRSVRHMILPRLFPSTGDRSSVDELLGKSRNFPDMIAVAPGSVWNTKRWPESRYVDLLRLLAADSLGIVLIGGKEDDELCDRIQHAVGSVSVVNTAGKLSPLQSAELISRCLVLVSNDTAPMHMGVAMQVPVIAIFGPTVPSFGFAPVGRSDRIVETMGLKCRPCGIHGGKSCPVHTFECMLAISVARVHNEVRAAIHARSAQKVKR
jgi:heptosyltransferase-2